MIPSAYDVAGRLLANVTWSDIAGLWLQATLIGVLGHAALLSLRRASAATRHLVALAALASLLALPFVSAVPKPWRTWSVATSLVPDSPRVTIAVAAGASVSAEPPVSSLSEDATTSESAPLEAQAAPARPADATPAGRVFPIVWPATVAALALGVSAFLLARIGLGWLAAGWTVRGAAEVLDPRLGRELDHARERLGLTSPVSLAMSHRLGVPIVSGLARATLVLPLDARAWSDERLRAVFLHELAHVRRHDAAGALATRITTALFWFHPLAWSLAREARRECERACDDVVLASGLRASDYADHLLAIARGAAGGRVPGMSLAFARVSSLEGRLLTVLRSDLRRGPVSARARLAVTAAALLLLLPLSTLRVVGASAETPGESLNDESGASSLGQSESSGLEDSWLETQKLETEIADSKSPSALYERAKELYDAEKYGAAGLAYEAAARGDYRPATAWYNAACSYSLDRQRLRALGALQKSIAAGYTDLAHIQSDDDLDYIRSDGRFRLMIDDLRNSDEGDRQRERAVSRYETLRDSGSEDAGEWNSAGIALMRAGETELAIKSFQRRVGIDGSASGIYNEACVEALDGRTNAALSTLERAIVAGFGPKEKLTSDADLVSLQNSPKFARLVDLADELTINHRGLDDRDQEAWRDELPRYQSVTRKHPDLGRAWFNLGYVQIRAGEAAASRESFARALDKDYRRPTTLYNLACASAQAHDRDAAIRWLAQAEAAGMDVWGNAKNDDDLDPLRSDDRFRAMMDRLERTHEDHKKKSNQKS